MPLGDGSEGIPAPLSGVSSVSSGAGGILTGLAAGPTAALSGFAAPLLASFLGQGPAIPETVLNARLAAAQSPLVFRPAILGAKTPEELLSLLLDFSTSRVDPSGRGFQIGLTLPSGEAVNPLGMEFGPLAGLIRGGGRLSVSSDFIGDVGPAIAQQILAIEEAQAGRPEFLARLRDPVTNQSPASVEDFLSLRALENLPLAPFIGQVVSAPSRLFPAFGPRSEGPLGGVSADPFLSSNILDQLDALRNLGPEVTGAPLALTPGGGFNPIPGTSGAVALVNTAALLAGGGIVETKDESVDQAILRNFLTFSSGEGE